MVDIRWNREFAVNIKEIDEHNRLLCAMLSRVVRGVGDGESKQVVMDAGRQLLTHCQRSYGIEKRYFEKFDYDGVYPHEVEHGFFMEDIETLIVDYDPHRVQDGVAMAERLCRILIGHLTGTDQRFADFVKKNCMKHFFRKATG